VGRRDLKPLLKYDDSLDVFGIHGVGGIVGALGTAIVANPSFGGYPLADYDMITGQFMKQLTASVAIVWSAVVALIAMFIVKAVFGGARVTERPKAMASTSPAMASAPTTRPERRQDATA
jgi:Amt family ammonium transporter